MAQYRRLIACFSDPLQETHCLFLRSITGDYCLFLGSLSAKTSILKLKEGRHEYLTLSIVFIKMITLIYEKNYFSDRVPLTDVMTKLVITAFMMKLVVSAYF